jgi:hypothetical protein
MRRRRLRGVQKPLALSLAPAYFIKKNNSNTNAVDDPKKSK